MLLPFVYNYRPKMFLTLVICISSLDDDIITLVLTIKRCHSLLIQVHIKLIAIYLLFCKFLMIVRGVIHLERTHEGKRGLSKRVGHAYKVGGRGVETSKCVH